MNTRPSSRENKEGSLVKKENSEMNAKQMLKKSVGMLLLAALAALLFTGTVAADHGTGPVHAHNSSRVRFEQYNEAVNTGMTAPVPAREATRVRFEQYREALAEHEAQLAASYNTLDARMNRLDAFGQYLLALEVMEQQLNAPLPEETEAPLNHDGVRFQQYLEALLESEQ